MTLIENLNHQGERRIIDNAKNEFMPVHAERLHQTRWGDFYSVHHEYEKDGEVISDPYMTFLVHEPEGVAPFIFQHDFPFIITEGACIERVEGEPETICVHEQEQASITAFANTWLIEIKKQQNL